MLHSEILLKNRRWQMQATLILFNDYTEPFAIFVPSHMRSNQDSEMRSNTSNQNNRSKFHRGQEAKLKGDGVPVTEEERAELP